MKSIKCVLETKGAKPEGNGKDKKKAKKPKKGEAERVATLASPPTTYSKV
jgi:hypothetical protein